MYCAKPTFRDLIEKTGSDGKDSLIEKAFSYAAEVHAGEKRSSGGPFIQHSLNTAMITSELGLDENTVVSALLHNILYKGKTTEEEVRERFGNEVTDLVIGINKINSIIGRNRKKIEMDVLSKLILATSKDMRAIFIKLADVLDSLRCIEIFNEQERNAIAKEALLLYSPICHKFGLTECRWEIEDLAFKQLDRKSYNWVKGKVKERREVREEKLRFLVNEVKDRLDRENIKAEVYGRAKHFYGIKQKMEKYKFNEIHDLLAIRIICDSVKDCYAILGIIHSMYEPIPDCFDDYIANPKPNNYRSIHADLRKSDGGVFEAQIRTWEMHNEAEEGSPAHWIYKSYREDKDFDKKITWTRQLMELTKKDKKAKKFVDSLNLDFGKNKVFVLTPRGEVVELAEGSTPIDFAFNIHSDIGRTCEKAKVNGKIVPLNYRLENGDEVEIITSKKQVPKRQWLSFVKTSKAISKIRQVLSLPELPKAKKEMRQRKLSLKERKTVRISKCCNPTPADEIVGFYTTKRKIMVHNKNCPNIIRESHEKAFDLSWSDIGKKEFEAEFRVFAEDRPGLLEDLVKVLSSINVSVKSTNAKVNKNHVSCELNVKIKNERDLDKLKESLSKVRGVKEVKKTF